MKNHIVFKFLAVLLCAASLLGAVGSGLGIGVLTAEDLYDKTVEQVYQEQAVKLGQAYAEETAKTYASINLGGMPSVTVEHILGHGTYFKEPNYGYRLLDAEGNELESRLPADRPRSTVYSFSVSGKYLHLVKAGSIAQEREKQTQQNAAYVYSDDGGAVLWDTVPESGAVIGEVRLDRENESDGASGENLGMAFRNREGGVVLRLSGWDIGLQREQELVTSVSVTDVTGALVYHAESPSGVGTIGYVQDGTLGLVFRSFYAGVPAAGTLPETAETAMPAEMTEAATEAVEELTEATEAPTETTAETVEETKAAEEATEETAEATQPEEETVPEETEAKKKKTSEETAPVTEPEEAEGAEETEPKKSKKKKTSEDTEEAETVAETVEDIPEPTAEATVEPTVEEPAAQDLPAEALAEPEAPVMINGKPLSEYQIHWDSYYDERRNENIRIQYVYVPVPEMTVEVHLAPGAIRSEAAYAVLRQVRQIRGYLFPALGLSLLLLAVSVVYLCCAAGRKPKSEEVRAAGLNRVPLDLYALVTVFGVLGSVAAIAAGGEYLLGQNAAVGMACCGGIGYLACLLVAGFGFAFVAQIKTPGGFLWRNSFCVICLRTALRLCVRCVETGGAKLLPVVVRLVKGLWGLLRRGWLACCRTMERFLRLLPVTWQWLIAGTAMVLFLFVTVAERYDFGIVLAVLVAFAMVLYGGRCFGTLLETTRKMSKGDLNTKVDDKLMVGAFKQFAGELNDLAGVAAVAAQKHLKSERMKTELITNVSHDIKTPLTSIINYVDLLQKPHTEEEEAQYLEVLDRQSQRLKKLIDDLMDMSKASTGNMAVDITVLDAVESVNQALGEFSDKLDRAQLVPVFRHTDASVTMMADGRLVWRVLSNLLSNAVKYAMPGTRLYIDLMELEGKVVISLKNISREELNVDAEELMERFVRGDGSRNTEGSGLGLNIAKSLMELQKGQLQLLVDGDLFKVTLIFPGA